VGGFGPDKGLRVCIVLIQVSVDGSLKVDDGPEDAAPEASSGQEEKKVSTALSQELEVGVKWNTQRECRASQARTFGCLWAA